MLRDLIRGIQERRVILFIGAGVSACLGVPTWSGLIRHIGEELGFDPDIFASPDANYLTLAEYYRLTTGSIGPLRSWMDRKWHVDDTKVAASEVHKLLVGLNTPIIYTTNYDRNIECAMRVHRKPFTKIVNVGDLSKIKESEAQIIKLHGDFDDDESIVLTETDYFEILSFESPLDIKLRADALANSILFLGYSLSDINIRLLLYKLWKIWDEAGHNNVRPSSYIFLSRPDPVQELVLKQWGIKTVTEDVDDPKNALVEFLRKLQP